MFCKSTLRSLRFCGMLPKTLCFVSSLKCQYCLGILQKNRKMVCLHIYCYICGLSCLYLFEERLRQSNQQSFMINPILLLFCVGERRSPWIQSHGNFVMYQRLMKLQQSSDTFDCQLSIRILLVCVDFFNKCCFGQYLLFHCVSQCQTFYQISLTLDVR